MSEESRGLVDAIATLLSIGVPPTQYEFAGNFHGTVVQKSGSSEVDSYEVWASATTGCWEVHTRSVKERRVFNPEDGLLMVEGRRREEIPTSERRSPPTHPAAKFAFPLRLPIWGRVPVDQWRMLGAGESENGISIALEDLNNPSVLGSLELSESGLPHSVGSDNERFVLLDAEPLMDTRRFYWRE